jgi:hypothetical protein
MIVVIMKLEKKSHKINQIMKINQIKKTLREIEKKKK